jgi:glycosyltransferase involved in cell wall biosynthesis
VDPDGNERLCTPAAFARQALPRVLYEIPLGAVAFLATGLTLALLNLSIFVRLFRVEPASAQLLPPSKARSICFFWSEVPENDSRFRVGGEISHIVGFFGGLARRGFTGSLVTALPIAHERLDPRLNQVIDDRGLPQWPGEVRQMAYNWKVLFRSRARLRKTRPALIYHRVSAYSFTGVLLSLCYRLPLIVEVNTSEVWEASVRGGTRFPALLSLAEKVSLAYAFRVAVVSKGVRDDLVARGTPEQRIVVNPNGVDADFFTPGAPDEAIVRKYGHAGKTVVGFLGSFNRYHGVDTLAKAVRLVAGSVDEVHFLFIGDGQLRSECEERIRQDGVARYVTMVGRIPHPEVPAHLNACHILVSCHRNMDDGTPFLGSPTKLFEYMAMGKAIVASRVGQIAEVLQDEETALLVEPDDPEKLAEAIFRLARDPALREALGARAREQVVARFTWDENVDRILSTVFGRNSRESSGIARLEEPARAAFGPEAPCSLDDR